MGTNHLQNILKIVSGVFDAFDEPWWAYLTSICFVKYYMANQSVKAFNLTYTEMLKNQFENLRRCRLKCVGGFAWTNVGSWECFLIREEGKLCETQFIKSGKKDAIDRRSFSFSSKKCSSTRKCTVINFSGQFELF